VPLAARDPASRRRTAAAAALLARVGEEIVTFAVAGCACDVGPLFLVRSCNLSPRISDLAVVLSPTEEASRLEFPGRARQEPRHKG
jgi:hypothetical protein